MNSTFQMGMNPIQVWFVCRLCKSSCQKIEEFIAHKQQKHFHEFQKIRCIIFEEKTLDQEFSKSFNVENFGTDFSSGVQHFQEPQTSSESGNMNKINTNEINSVVGTKTINAQQYFRQVDHQSGAGTGGGGGGVGVLEELRGYRYAIEPQSSRTADSDLIVHSQTQVNDNITFNVSVPVLPHDQSRLNFEINNLSQQHVVTPSGFCPNNNSDKNPSLQVPTVQIKKECIPILTSTPPSQRTEKRPVCCSFSKLNFDLNPQDLSLLIEIDPDPASDNFGIGTDSKIPYEYQCKLCGTKFDSDREVRIHIKHCWVHNKQRHRFCVLCKKSFFDAFAYRRHILRFHATEEEKASRPKFTCYFCPKEFTEKSSLKKHFLKFHVTSHKGSSSSSSSMKLAGGPGPDGIPSPHARPFICQLCGVDFGRQADLTKHERTHSHHSDPNPHHPVPNCSNNSNNNNSSSNNKSFQTFQTFLNPHSESLSRQFKCTQNNCSKTFTRSYHLTRHMVQKHSAEGDLKTFKCETCNKTFSTRSLLQNHSSVHTQDKPYKCTHLGCSSAFKRKDVLVQHEKTHTGERPHKCDVCGKAFSKRFSYLKHSRIHTNNSNNNSQNQNQHHPALSLC